MSRKVVIKINDQGFNARTGKILLDAALDQGIAVPHDCRAGQCGTCLVRLKRGVLLGGDTSQPGLFHACQARILSDADITFEKMPPVGERRGVVAAIENLAPDILGVCIQTERRLRHRPGQYYRVKFRGFPARCFSPAPPFAGRDAANVARFHIKIVRDGRVTPNLGGEIAVGHKVTLEGPFGAAFFRPGEGRRIVLVASGTGFAPIWAVAHASLRTQPEIPLLLIAGARKLSSLYAVPALCRLALYPRASFIAATEDADRHAPSEIIRPGTPLDHLPPLLDTDLIYAAGSPKLVDAVAKRAARVGAAVFADAFVANPQEEPTWLDSLRQTLELARKGLSSAPQLVRRATQTQGTDAR